jgi:hypothetical protein
MDPALQKLVWLRAESRCEYCQFPADVALRLFNPRRDCWSDHFAWNGPYLVGKTDIGTVTIDVLAINLQYRVAIRTALIEEGIFPPLV